MSLNSSPLPALLPSQNGCAQTALGGTLDVRPDGRFTGHYQYQVDCRYYGRQTMNEAISGRYTQTGADLVFAADSGFSRFATAPLVAGTVNGSILSVRSTPAPAMTVTMTLQRR